MKPDKQFVKCSRCRLEESQNQTKTILKKGKGKATVCVSNLSQVAPIIVRALCKVRTIAVT